MAWLAAYWPVRVATERLSRSCCAGLSGAAKVATSARTAARTELASDAPAGVTVFVFPQYNWGYPGVLKNALDYLDDEWHGKPASFATYGTRGGSKAAAQFVMVLNGLHMRVLDHVEAVIADDDVDAGGQLIDSGATLAPTLGQLAKLDAQLTEALEVATGP
jgi:NAD(P)H-dependent FMN reductase